ncbi:MAG: DNA gyrase subunit A [Nanoarchaeota archaeon]|nr:DNA gyrase subunit A [Nanoarchaeota archaeon]
MQGQGNFGCFTADTKVKLVDGRELSFIELVEENKSGKSNFTFTVDENDLIKIAEIKNPRLTKKHQEIMKVVLDNGEEIKCTLNHKFMLKDGGYREAKDLKAGDSLMPSYFRHSTKEDDVNAVGYSMIFQPSLNLWNFVHVLSDDWNLENRVYNRSSGRLRHHLDFNKLNNSPGNIRRMNWEEHWKTHYEFTSEKHKSNPEYCAKLAAGRKKFWSNPENREAYSKRMRSRNLANWSDAEYRKQMSVTLSETNKNYLREHPEAIERFSKTASSTLKRLWKIPEYRKLFHDKIVASNKKRITNFTGKKKFLKICFYLKEKNIPLTEENFEKVRIDVFGRKSFTSWEKGLNKYYLGNRNLLMCEVSGNHKVAKVEFLREFADVYDLTVDKTHNFSLAAGVFVHNSIDGDSAAAMRYVEARMAKIGEEMLADIEKATVPFVPNFDGTLKEPTVLPSKIPNLLVNGSSGIAVGMATNIPPHNLHEIANAAIAIIDNPEIELNELMQIVPGPDFPTGGIICGNSGVIDYFKTGRGKIITRAKTKIEDKKNKQAIIISEIPYQVNKSTLLEEMVELIKEKKVTGISDIRDESDRNGIRVVIELKQGFNPEVILNQLYKHTRLQTTFGVIMLALVNNEPLVLNLKDMIKYYIVHRRRIVIRRTQFNLKKASERAHILKGLIIALKNVDEVIKKIRASNSIEDAKNTLMDNYHLSELQAKAILDMKLQKLASLEQEKIRKEHLELIELIKELQILLADDVKILGIIKKELEEIKSHYDDERRTLIENVELDIETKDLIKKEDVVVTCTHSGYIKRIPLETYKQQKRGGKGIIATETKEEDIVKHLFIASTHDYILFFTTKGKVHWQEVYQVPEGSRQSKGKPVINLFELDKDEMITTIIPVSEFKEDLFLFMATKKGTAKKTALIEYSNPRKGGIKAIELDEGDELVEVLLTDGKKQIIIATAEGMAVKFIESDVRPIGRTGRGVRGISLKDDDYVVGVDLADDSKTLLTVTENGFGKRTPLEDYRLINRGGVGVINIKTSDRNGRVVAVKEVSEEDELFLISKNGIIIRTPVKDISIIGRNTQGVTLMKLEEGDKVVACAKIDVE